jgi:CheY-like chemotaxis protein
MFSILIADDEDRQRENITRVAREVGFPPECIIEAVSEAQAIDLIKRQAFGVAIIDIMLADPPVGEEGIRVIRELSALQPDCRIIALTTKKEGTAVGVRALEAGAHDFVSSKLDLVNWTALLRQRVSLWKGVVEGELPSAALEV